VCPEYEGVAHFDAAEDAIELPAVGHKLRHNDESGITQEIETGGEH
jgi:hypothetical protein